MEIARSKVRTIGRMIIKWSELLGGNARAINAVNTWLNELVNEEYNMEILKLVDRYDRCLNGGGIDITLENSDIISECSQTCFLYPEHRQQWCNGKVLTSGDSIFKTSFSTFQILNLAGLNTRVTRHSSQRKPPWKGSQHNIQHPGATSKRNFMPSPPNSGRMNGTTMTLEETSTSSFQTSRLPQLPGKGQKLCLQRGIAHSQLTLRDLASERQIIVVVASWETLCISQPTALLQGHFILPSPGTT
ncbi:hypothetical protein AVEN_271791-1 [Araneus ventricosus]|uniref:Uncharacterized protein n=1 Tax=Araneus ventricosus TaxID=182803 RepID=A0A4Y2IIG4_ARAVE|nr:hypothetical protein AVEN_271791-1 [Araneus ventricosus]